MKTFLTLEMSFWCVFEDGYLFTILEAHKLDVVAASDKHSFLTYAAMHHPILLQVLEAQDDLVHDLDGRCFLNPKWYVWLLPPHGELFDDELPLKILKNQEYVVSCFDHFEELDDGEVVESF